MKNVILVGDSIRIGYQDEVRAQLAGRAEVRTPEENGLTSENVLKHLDEWVIGRNADLLHINCGLHDLRREFGAGTPAVPLDAYADNMRTIISRVRDETDMQIVWALTTPVNHLWHRQNKPFDRFEEDVEAYNDAALSVANAIGVTVNDLFSVITAAGRDELLLPDGVHFSPEGYKMLGQAVADCIRRML